MLARGARCDARVGHTGRTMPEAMVDGCGEQQLERRIFAEW
jgi:hypothetical protein